MYPHVRQLETHRRLGQARAPRADAPSRTPGPPRYKLALLTWIGAYAVITSMLALLGPTMATWPLALRTLVLSVAMVVTLTWVVMPRLTRLFGGWLRPSV
jgi:antibiotic biosynthesis monooxygenase (ABM) superfamily enzyme